MHHPGATEKNINNSKKGPRKKKVYVIRTQPSSSLLLFPFCLFIHQTIQLPVCQTLISSFSCNCRVVYTLSGLPRDPERTLPKASRSHYFSYSRSSPAPAPSGRVVGTTEAGRLWDFCSLLSPLHVGFPDSFSPSGTLRGKNIQFHVGLQHLRKMIIRLA